MNRREYTDRVLAGLRRVTPRERAAIRAELDAHMEDHICDLLDLGYDAQLAEERTMAHMGDPEEVGRALNRQYPLGWLIAQWAAAAMTIVLLFVLAAPLRNRLSSSVDSLWARWLPTYTADIAEQEDAEGPLVTAVWDPGVELHVEDIHIRVYQAGVDDPMTGTEAWLAVAWWRENPFLQQPDNGMMELYIDGTLAQWGSFFYGDCVRGIPVTVEYGDTPELSVEIYGKRYTRAVPLPWKEADG